MANGIVTAADIANVSKDHLSDPTLNFLANLPKAEESTMLDLDLPWIEDAPKAVPELTPEGYPVITLTQTEDDIGAEEALTV